MWMWMTGWTYLGMWEPHQKNFPEINAINHLHNFLQPGNGCLGCPRMSIHWEHQLVTSIHVQRWYCLMLCQTLAFLALPRFSVCLLGLWQHKANGMSDCSQHWSNFVYYSLLNHYDLMLLPTNFPKELRYPRITLTLFWTCILKE